MKHGPVAVALAAIVLGIAGLGMGACSAPPRPAVERTAEAPSALINFWQNNAECGFGGCSGGQVRTCGNVCATPISVGNSCSQDDCQSNSVCETGASCVWISGGFQCAFPPFGMTMFSDCSLDPDGCAHDLWCRDFAACTTAPNYGQRCAAGVPQGYSCDSEWDAPDCKPCMPGMDCVGTSGNKKCRVKCDTSADCPCGDSGAENGCNPDDNHCYICRSTGQSCSENTLCCDEGTICGPVSEKCCPAIGSSCSNNAGCCDEHICLSTGECGECIADEAACTDSQDCCSELCVNGVCRTDCTNEVGDPCPVDAQKGECAKGEVTCDNYVRQCVQVNDPTDEICDNKDNDCDGVTDDDPKDLAACSGNPPPGCQAGFTAAGFEICVNGTVVCESTEGVDFCTACNTNLADMSNCGYCTAGTTQCSSNSDCPPGARCTYDSNLQYNTCHDDPNCSTVYSCWMPSMNGTCP